MGVFDFETNCAGGNNRIKDECIIAFKVYDSCRQQDCLDRAQVGLARAAKSGTFCGTSYDAGELIVPPPLATGVFMKDVKVKKVNVLSKTESQFKRGILNLLILLNTNLYLRVLVVLKFAEFLHKTHLLSLFHSLVQRQLTLQSLQI